MLEHLFGSKTRLKLLKLFFREPHRAFFVRELTRVLDVQINAVRRELQLLVKAGLLIESDPPGNVSKEKAGAALRKYYLLNAESILYPEIQALLRKGQILGEQKFMEELGKKIGNVALLLLTGKFTDAHNVQTDILIVGAIKESALEKLIGVYEKELGFSIRYTILTTKEFEDRRHVMDKFLYSLFEAEHIVVVNNLKEIKKEEYVPIH